MSLTQNSNLGQGGAGLSGSGPGSLAAVLKELQGLNVTLLPGKGAGVKNDLAGIRTEDTIIAAFNNNAGALTDVKATTAIVDCRASGTITADTVLAANTATVAGKQYTFVASDAVVGALEYNKVKLGATDADTAANLAAAINRYEASRNSQVSASALAAVVTVTAVAEGTGGNALTLASSGATLAVSGATLAGGTATGGITVVGATDQVILYWFNKQ